METLTNAMQYLIESRGIRSGCDLYTNKDALAARRVLGLAASAVRNGYEPDFRKVN